MPTIEAEADVFFTYKGVTFYHVYKYDDKEHGEVRNYSYSLSADSRDEDDDYGVFVDELDTWKGLANGETLHGAIKAALRAAVDGGDQKLIDLIAVAREDGFEDAWAVDGEAFEKANHVCDALCNDKTCPQIIGEDKADKSATEATSDDHGLITSLKTYALRSALCDYMSDIPGKLTPEQVLELIENATEQDFDDVCEAHGLDVWDAFQYTSPSDLAQYIKDATQSRLSEYSDVLAQSSTTPVVPSEQMLKDGRVSHSPESEIYVCDKCSHQTTVAPDLGDVCKVCGGSDISPAESFPVNVYLESAGSSEGFEYDSLEEALEGVGRLTRSGRDQFKQDGIARQITIYIDQAEFDSEKAED